MRTVRLLYGTRKHSVYMDTMFTRRYGSLVCMVEPQNSHDRNAVAAEKDGKIIGHFPQKESQLCTLFLKRGGNVHCSVIVTAVQFFVRLIFRHA